MTTPPHDPGPAGELFTAPQRRARTRRRLAVVVLGAAAGLFAGLVLDRPFDLIAPVGVAVTTGVRNELVVGSRPVAGHSGRYARRPTPSRQPCLP